jgi:hypothetical protein
MFWPDLPVFAKYLLSLTSMMTSLVAPADINADSGCNDCANVSEDRVKTTGEDNTKLVKQLSHGQRQNRTTAVATAKQDVRDRGLCVT